MKRITVLLLFSFVLCSGFVCSPLERSAYNTVVAAKAFTDKIKAQHPECTATNQGSLCVDLRKATAAKDTLIDAVEIYCAGPSFDGGGACQPPTKGTAAYDQAISKLNAAIAAYNQTETDLKAVIR